MKKISVIIPVLNEEENIQAIYNRLSSILKKIKDRYCYEILFNDNNSDDNSFKILKEIAKQDKNVKVLKFSRNFGYQQSILAGYKNSSGDIAIQLDCDMQDPPEMIIDFLDSYELGYDVVFGVRESRKENFFINFLRTFFYWFIDSLSEDHLPRNAGDFRLVNKKVIQEIIKIKDSQPYIRGSIAAMGFKQIGISYARNARTKGKSKFGIKKLLSLGLDGILNHSIVPLRISTFIGVFISLVTFFMAMFYIFGKLVYGSGWNAGFATTTVLILLSLSVNALLLGIIGEYLGRIYKQLKSTSEVIISEKLNLD